MSRGSGDGSKSPKGGGVQGYTLRGPHGRIDYVGVTNDFESCPRHPSGYNRTSCRQYRTGKWETVSMDMAQRKEALLEMKADLKERLDRARADYDAVERLLLVHEEMLPPPEQATVEEVRAAAASVLAPDGRTHSPPSDTE